MRVATKQFIEKCDRACVPPAGKVMGLSVLRACPGYGIKFTVDFKVHGKKASKARLKGSYCDAQIGKARDKFLSLAFVEKIKKWSAYVFDIIINPLNSSNLSPQQRRKLNKNIFTKVKKGFAPEKRHKSDTKKGSKNRDRLEGLEQQQHYLAIRSLLFKTGFKFMPHVISQIANYSAKAIALSIQYIQGRMASRKPVSNPEGYFLDCLKRGYWECIEDRQSNLTHWEEVVRSVKTGLDVIKQRGEELLAKGIESDRAESNKLQQLIACLEDEYYGGNAIAELVALTEGGYV